MNFFKSFGVVIVVILALVVWSSTFIVDQRKKALVLRFGEINRIVEKPGLYFKVPFADEVVPIENRMILWTSDNMSVQVVDGRRYLVDAVTMARVVNAQRFRETVGADLTRAWDRIRTRLDAALRQTYGKRTFDAALSKDRAVMMREIRDQVRAEALNNGIEIVDVRIVRTDLMDEVLKNTYERMSSERIAEAKDLRGRGEARKIEIMAQADRAYTEKLADAQRQSEVIRGEGEGERNRIFADAFQKDPEFFDFYRSMQAYTNSLSDPGTTMVLKPDSDFFKYLGMDKAKPATP
ncbi:protease modulator HflC [Nordella sp. HKS 07]|uniref:protease modulator HflC n=1 Tax=Nordella sp. HKS 07 TaxID=2712222 RepID=UPI0013E102A0|nr:protease modulator HflC [Nordella sp. HKS 07]QIG51887.1 protease modulator HflC [Nordella sp. HKS 07]